uniref:Zn-dependent exopeptidases superfamily protein n=1 Tax=Hesperocyparis bakeri TaxID=329080 RepID=A0A3Q8CJW2_9CONI|nr:Zn-dependent exopeptidases superfamily protein [Hesperocyparis bakeri]
MVKPSKSEVHPVVADFIDFLNASPTAFHAVDEAKRRLKHSGYEQLFEREDWNLKEGGKYFFTRNYSTIIAFAIGQKYTAGNGFHIVGAHTDSPCLKLKPSSKVSKGGFLEVGVQTYGGGLWHTWFDRDLSVAGRVIVKKNIKGVPSYSHELVRIQEPILRVPTLAIHLDRGSNDGFKVNTQSHLLPVLATAIKAEVNRKGDPNEKGMTATNGDQKSEKDQKSAEGEDSDNKKHHLLLLELLASKLGCEAEEICDFELQLCDTQPSVVAGVEKEFIFSGRLDNLCMSFCSLKALLDGTASEESLQDETGVRMVALFDHEEVGSNSAQGAGSPVMLDAFSRITSSLSAHGSKVSLEKVIQRSFLVSADMAHCLHPNYMDKHEDNHQPRMHNGLVIKNNANQRYATNAVTSVIFREIGKKHKIPVQDFVVRNDMGCGSTIGPILASGVGIRTVDVGAPQLSMHSIREMCGVDDVIYSYEHLKAYFEEFTNLDSQIKVDF